MVKFHRFFWKVKIFLDFDRPQKNHQFSFRNFSWFFFLNRLQKHVLILILSEWKIFLGSVSIPSKQKKSGRKFSFSSYPVWYQAITSNLSKISGDPLFIQKKITRGLEVFLIRVKNFKNKSSLRRSQEGTVNCWFARVSKFSKEIFMLFLWEIQVFYLLSI